MTCHAFLLSSVLLLALQLAAGPACAQDLEQTEGPWRRDPFRYEAASPQKVEHGVDRSVAVKAQQGLKLKGIVLSRDGQYRALINDREVKQGDTVENARILRISRFDVVVEEQGVSRTIDLFNNQIEWGD